MKVFISNVDNFENFDEITACNCEAVGYSGNLTMETGVVTYQSERVEVTNCYLTVGNPIKSAQYTTYAGAIPVLENILEKAGFHYINGTTYSTYCLSLYGKSQQQAFLHIEASLGRSGWFIDLI